jgi:integrase
LPDFCRTAKFLDNSKSALRRTFFETSKFLPSKSHYYLGGLEMAYIQKRGEFWRAEVNRKGYKPVYRSFDTRKEADAWATQTEAAMTTGAFVDKKLADNTTLAQALERYRQKIVPDKLHPYQENKRIDRWLSHDLAYRTLGNLRGRDFAEYRDARRAAGRAENTIRLELSIISHLFETARKEWGMAGLINPVEDIQLPSGSVERERRLDRKEHIRLRRHLRQSKNPYAIHAFDLAIETSLRQGTLFKLRWEWVNFDTHMITIPRSERRVKNKGVPAIVPMSTRTFAILRKLHTKMMLEQNGGKANGFILNTTQNAVVCVWKKAVARLEIEDLRWHDLRHEATSRLFERGLAVMEVASMTGHRSMQMLKRYTHLNPENFREKLG